MHVTNRLKALMVFLLFSLVLSPAALSAAELSQGEKATVFIGELKVQQSIIDRANRLNRSLELNRLAQSLDSQFISSLNATRLFQLVERKRKGDLELEQGFAAVAVDPNDRNAAKAGKMAGAKFAFLPQVDGFDDLSETIEQRANGRTALERKLFVSVVVQVIDTTTGELLPESPTVQLSMTESVSAQQGQAQTGDQVIVELARETARQLSQELASLLRPAKVLASTGRQITINRGTEAGFQNGDRLEIFAARSIKDEDTGEMFSEEFKVGDATITRIDKKQSTAVVNGEDLGIAKGCIVKAVAKKENAGENSEYMSPGSREKPVGW